MEAKLAVLLLICTVANARPQFDGIPKQFRNINFENYLRNERAVQFQLKCLLYDGPCDSIGKYIKRNIPVWLRTQCKNCNEETKQHAGKLIKFFQENYPKDWDAAIDKYGKEHFTQEEIDRFEEELGVKIIRDPNAPTVQGKPDKDALAKLARESLDFIKTTKEPLVLGQKGSNVTTVVTLSPENEAKINKLVSKYEKTTPTTMDKTTSTTTTPSPPADAESETTEAA